MVTTTVSKPQPAFRGIRPFRARTDLYGMARLLEEAFRREQRFPFSRFSWLREVGIFLWTLSYVPTFPETLEGFVWIEDGQVVGNITMTRDETHGDWHYISNVAVKKEYQRRGIARALLHAALEHLRRQHATRVRLNVRPQNEGAIKLYHDVGFQVLEMRGQWHLSTLPIHLPAISFTDLRPLRSSDRHAVRELVRTVTPIDVRPFHAPVFEPEWEARLGEWLSNVFLLQTTQRWALEREHRLAALLFVRAHTWMTPHHLMIEVHPDFRGRVEDDLILAACQWLAQFSPREIRADASSLHPELIRALERHGFYFSNGMMLMELVL